MPCPPPGYYYQPCQDSSNVDNYLQFQENTTVNYKVRVKNTGNINLSSLTYAFTSQRDVGRRTGNCSTLPTSLASGAAAAFCSFTRSATSTDPSGTADDVVAIAAAGTASGLPTGATNGRRVDQGRAGTAPRDNLKASPYRLGGTGYGRVASPTYHDGRSDARPRQWPRRSTEIQNPTGWF